MDRNVFNHNSVGLLLTTALLCLAIGWWGIVASALSMFLYVMISSTINGLCHWIGTKNFENTACNVQAVAWISAGEGLHNNHHAFPACPKLSMRHGEWDPAWFSIKMLKALWLCTPAKTILISASVLHVTVAKRLAHKPTLVDAED